MSQPSAALPLWNAVVLGGGDPGDPFAAAHGVGVKALIPLSGEPLGLHVLRALRESGRVGRVAYVGPTTPEMDALLDERVTDAGSLLSNLEAGVRALPTAPRGEAARVLVVTADIPLMTGDMLRDVLEQAAREAPGAALVYPVVPREACEAAFPGVKRTYVTLTDGTFTGGNLFLLDPHLIHQFLPRLREVLAARKAPLKLASLIGFSVLLRLLTRRLDIATLENKVSEIMGVPARALVTLHAAVGTDIDKESDLELARRVLEG